MSQDGLYYFESTNTAQGGPRLIRVSPANPLPVNTGASGGTQNVNVSQVGGSAIALGAATTSASALPVTIAQDVTMPITGTVTATFGAGTNSIGTVGLNAGSNVIGALTANQSVNCAQMNGVAVTMGNGVSGTGVQRVTIASDSTGQITLASGATIQTVGGSTGGMHVVNGIVANNTTAVSVKGSAGTLYGIQAYNNSSTIAYIKVYNSTAPTAGSSTNLVDRIMIPAPAAGGGGGLVWQVPGGVNFSTGISYIVTTGIADNDTTAPAANTYLVSFYYV